MSEQPQRTYGPWRCVRRIGRGGNATVWLATNDVGREVALKVVERKPHTEPYQRFVREISFLRELGPFDGVLPVIDASLPEPGSDELPWLAMGRATPIADALTDEPLEMVVSAMQVIADTLARLAAEHRVGHRDIKPGNLYGLDGQWLVGDFGLIDVPDLDELTRTGQQLGPAHFTAYEVISDPRNAPSGPADVYSLGKTLHVLATDERWPPTGHQRTDATGYRLSDFRPHPKARLLDELIDRMTRLDPAERPSMAQVAEDLAAWERLTLSAVDLEISDLSAQYQAKQAAAFAQRDQQREWERLGGEAVAELDGRLTGLWTSLTQLDPEADLNAADELFSNVLTSVHGPRRHQDVLRRWLRAARVSAGDPRNPYALRVGCVANVFDDGTLSIGWMLVVGPVRAAGSQFRDERLGMEAPVGSVAQQELFEHFIDALRERMLEGVKVFVEQAPQPR